jgi:3-deoxy-D-manno-octulosonic-acid transferase
MQWIYCILIRLYYFSIVLVSPFNVKAKLWLTGRKNIFERLMSEIQNQPNIIWFHCASLGEFEQGRPVIEEYKLQNPDQKILLTFFSPSGYEIRKNYKGADWVFYLPLDILKNVKQFLEIVQPKKVVFVKYEFWYNYLKSIYKKNIPVYLISAIFRKEQLFFKWYGGWYRKVLSYFSHIFVQNEDSLTLLKSIHVANVSIAGDTRFDRVYNIANQNKDISEAKMFVENSKVLIAGSTWPLDEEILIPYINNSAIDLKFIIAQHEISEKGLARLEKNLKISAVRFSKANNVDLLNARVLIIDSIGMLSLLYKYGNIAYIGGGFGNGIHNILEAAVFGLPVLFGPNHTKFSEATELLSLKGAFSVITYEELSGTLNNLFEKADYLQTTSQITKKYVNDRIGATQKIFSKIN